MKAKLTKGILLILSLLCILCVPVTPVYAAQQGTDGSELQVVKAEQLEIQLGTSWSGVEFQLKTDAGVYPGTVKVGTDGVLRLEIGGSSQYILTCINSSTSIPEPEDTADSTDRTQAPATTEQSPEANEKAASGIPTLHIILFAGGMVIAIGTLIVMQVLKKKRENEAPDDEEDEEELPEVAEPKVKYETKRKPLVEPSKPVSTPTYRPAYVPPTPTAQPVAKKPTVHVDTSKVHAGTIVSHKAFGTGQVKGIDGGLIVVVFGGVDKKFQFPGAFEQGFLKLDEE